MLIRRLIAGSAVLSLLALAGCPGGDMVDSGTDAHDARRDAPTADVVDVIDASDVTVFDEGIGDAQDAGRPDTGPIVDVQDVVDAGSDDVVDVTPVDASVDDAMDAQTADAVDVVDVAQDSGTVDVLDASDVPTPVDVQDVTDVPAVSDASDGAAPTGTLLFLGTGGPTVLAGANVGGTWALTMLSDSSTDRPALAMTGATTAVGLIRSVSNGGELRYTTYNAGTWTPFAAISAGVTTRATPSIAADVSGRADVLFQGDDFKHYFAQRTAGTWSTTAEPVGPLGNQSFGPTPGTITEQPTGPIIAYAGGNGDVFDQARVGTLWQASDAHGVAGTASQTPTIIALDATGGLLLVYVRMSDAQVMYSTRANATAAWTTPQGIPSALSNDPVSAVAISGGAAIAFRGLDSHVYAARFTPTAATPWSIPIQPPRSDTTPSQPALAVGINGDAAELLYASSTDMAVHHCRLVGTSWNNCVLVGGTAITGVAAAAAP